MEVAEVYTKFRKSLYGYIYSKIKHKEDAEDILQNVFVKMQTNGAKLAEYEKIQYWLYRITRNSIIDHYRAKSGKKIRLEWKDEFTIDLPEEETHDNTKGLDACLTGFIDALPNDYKSIIIDSEIKGIAQKELSGKYNLAYPTMRSRVQRGREKLYKMMLNCCHIETDNRGNIIEATKKDNCNEKDCCR
ncbi:MAG TPA: sigma-70 family RNA polymerase sigma factor [Flavobacteriales bacterium]|nr:sigma-70 family RNA polymerase sigma factor [Flavobacteriales bacterium]